MQVAEYEMDHRTPPKQAAEPPTSVGGTGLPSIATTGAIITGTINYRYTPEFPDDARGRVKLEQIRAARVFKEKSKAVRVEVRLRSMRITCAMQPAIAFAREAIRLGWDANRTDYAVRSFALAAGIWAGLETHGAPGILEQLEASPEWQQYEAILLGSAGVRISGDTLEGIGGSSPDQIPGDPTKNAGNLSQSTLAETNGVNTPRDLIAAFISRLDEAGFQITRKNIWRVAGYKDGTEFGRFQRSDTRTTKSAAAAFNRVLKMSPEDFIRALRSQEKKTPPK